jgi:hypothetical protein
MPSAAAVAVEKQRDHHGRVERRPAVTISPIRATERVQIQRVHRGEHDEHQVALGEPLTHVGRHQELLIPFGYWDGVMSGPRCTRRDPGVLA